MTFTLSGLLASTAGCACLYLASDNQRWRAAPWPARPARAAAAVLLVLGLLGLLQDMQRVPAVFTFVTVVMLALALMPYIGALRPARGER